VLLAVNFLERTLGIDPTDLPLFKKGQRLFAREINGLLPPVNALREHLKLRAEWKGFPVTDGQAFTAAQLNELYGRINEAIEAVQRGPGRRDA
jgi:hypothetical protein